MIAVCIENMSEKTGLTALEIGKEYEVTDAKSLGCPRDGYYVVTGFEFAANGARSAYDKNMFAPPNGDQDERKLDHAEPIVSILTLKEI